jgi:two-component system CAI-1 autoinducer sensor kinase/phosphatase CqsS
MAKFIDTSSLRLDIFSVIVVLINCIFINVYSYEYRIEEADLILNGSIFVYCICVISIVLHFFREAVDRQKLLLLWLLCLTAGLVFLPTYTVLVTGGKKYLLLNLSSSLLVLAIMSDWVIFMVSSTFGVSAAFIIFLLSKTNYDLSFLHPSKKTYFIYYIVSYTFIAISLFMRRREKVQEKKMDFMKVFGSAIAHEVNAPLSSMKMMAEVLDSIIGSMNVSKKRDNYTLTINEIDYNMLTDVIREGMKKSANDAIQIVEMLLAAIREKYTNYNSRVKISSIVKDAILLASHLDPNNDKILLRINSDFEIIGNVKLVKHVIYNLIKNSFKHGGGDIEILIEVENYKLTVTDNGVGISNDKIDKIFSAFFTDGHGTGIGLAFAKFVLDDMNANISCESTIGKFTRFAIKFEEIYE